MWRVSLAEPGLLRTCEVINFALKGFLRSWRVGFVSAGEVAGGGCGEEIELVIGNASSAAVIHWSAVAS